MTVCACACVCVFPWRTLQFGFHGDVREAPQHGDDLIVLLLDQEAQHAASLRVLQTHQVLQAPHLVLQHTGGGGHEARTSQCIMGYIVGHIERTQVSSNTCKVLNKRLNIDAQHNRCSQNGGGHRNVISRCNSPIETYTVRVTMKQLQFHPIPYGSLIHIILQ